MRNEKQPFPDESLTDDARNDHLFLEEPNWKDAHCNSACPLRLSFVHRSRGIGSRPVSPMSVANCCAALVGRFVALFSLQCVCLAWSRALIAHMSHEVQGHRPASPKTRPKKKRATNARTETTFAGQSMKSLMARVSW